MATTNLIKDWTGTFIIKDWTGEQPPDGHPLVRMACWHDLKQFCTTRCAALHIGQDLAAGMQHVHCRALGDTPCIGYLLEEDQLWPRRVD